MVKKNQKQSRRSPLDVKVIYAAFTKSTYRQKTYAVVAIACIVLLAVVIIKSLNNHSSLNPFHHTTTLTQAQYAQQYTAAVQKGNYNEAIQVVNDSQNPTSEINLITIANLYSGEHKYSQALTTLRQAQSKYGMDYNLAMDVGQVEALLHNKNQALTYYQQALKLIQQAAPGKIYNAAQLETYIQNIITGLQQT